MSNKNSGFGHGPYTHNKYFALLESLWPCFLLQSKKNLGTIQSRRRKIHVLVYIATIVGKPLTSGGKLSFFVS